MTAPLLSVNGIEVIYNHVILVLKGVSLTVPEGRIVALLGANGAGKTTTLRAVSNLLHGERGDVTKGSIEYRGEKIDKLTAYELVKRGVVQVMEGRRCFAHLTVEENLLTGAYSRGSSRRGNSRAEIASDLDKVYAYFPAAQAAPHQSVGLHLGRRAADDRDRPRTDGAPVDDPARRAVDGTGAAGGRGDLRHRAGSEQEGAGVVPAGGAEHQRRIAFRGLRVHPGKRPRGHGRRGAAPCARTRTSRSSTSEFRRRDARVSAMPSSTSAASAGWLEIERASIFRASMRGVFASMRGLAKAGSGPRIHRGA